MNEIQAVGVLQDMSPAMVGLDNNISSPCTVELSGTELGTLRPLVLGGIIEKLKFGLRQGIKLIELYALMKSEF